MAGRACRKDLRVKKRKEISSIEYEDAFNYLVYWEQNKRLTMREVIKLVPKSVMVKLNNYNLSVPHIILGGRVRNFPVDFSRNINIPIIPYGVLAKLIVLFHHDKHHREVDTIVAYVRSEVLPIKVRKIASSIDAR